MSNSKENMEREIDKLMPLVKSMMMGQVTMKDLYEITDDEIEAIYSAGFNFYQHGKFDKAKEIFSSLCRLNYTDPRYFMGLAACHQMLKDYEKAIDTYSVAGLLEMTDPRPPFHAASCMLSLKKIEDAKVAFGSVIAICGEKEEHKEVKKQAENLLEGLQKKEKK